MLQIITPNLKYNADGDQVAYLEGDIVRVQAHWNSPTSSLWLKAQSDIPMSSLERRSSR